MQYDHPLKTAFVKKIARGGGVCVYVCLNE